MSDYQNQIKRGEIYYADLASQGENSSVQSGYRPVLVIQNDIGNAHSPTTIIVPLTSKKKRRDLPTHVRIQASAETGLQKDSVALLEQVRTVDKAKLKSKVGFLRDIGPLNHALLISVGLSDALVDNRC